MEELLRDYLPILIFLGMAVALGLILILAAVVAAVKNQTPKKSPPMNAALTHLMMRG